MDNNTPSEPDKSLDTASEPNPDNGSPSEPEKTVSDLFIEPKEEPKDRKEVAREKAADKIVESWAVKLANDEVTEDDVPSWARQKAIAKRDGIISEAEKEYAERQEFTELNERIARLEAEKTESQRIKEKQESERMMSEFLAEHGMTPQQFHEEYWDDFYENRQNFVGKQIPQDEATELALIKVAKAHTKKVKEQTAAKQGFAGTPQSGTAKTSKQVRITEKQAEMAKKFGNDPAKVYG